MNYFNTFFIAAEGTEKKEKKIYFVHPKNLFSHVFSVANFLLLFVLSSVFIVAQDTGGVKGKVRAANGDGISSATVTARQNGEDVKSVASDAKGNFVLENLKPGNYNIVFNKSGYSSGVLYNVEVKKKKTSDLGGRLILTVDQGTQVIIKGTVFDSAGRSIAGVKVDIEKVLSDGSTKKINSSYTSSGNDPGVRGGDGNARGEFTFRFSEGAAKYRITASMKDSTASKVIEVDNAAIYRLAITLNPTKN
jgi:hypothetical protein